MAALLYLGAGVGVLILMIIRGAVGGGKTETHIAKSDFPYVMGMIALDIAAPILFMYGLENSNPATVSLLGTSKSLQQLSSHLYYSANILVEDFGRQYFLLPFHASFCL